MLARDPLVLQRSAPQSAVRWRSALRWADRFPLYLGLDGSYRTPEGWRYQGGLLQPSASAPTPRLDGPGYSFALASAQSFSQAAPHPLSAATALTALWVARCATGATFQRIVSSIAFGVAGFSLYRDIGVDRAVVQLVVGGVNRTVNSPLLIWPVGSWICLGFRYDPATGASSFFSPDRKADVAGAAGNLSTGAVALTIGGGFGQELDGDLAALALLDEALDDDTILAWLREYQQMEGQAA